MTFKENDVTKSNYLTPQGMFIIEVKTNKLNINMKENIEVDIDYNIEIMDMFKGRNLIKLNICK